MDSGNLVKEGCSKVLMNSETLKLLDTSRHYAERDEVSLGNDAPVSSKSRQMWL